MSSPSDPPTPLPEFVYKITTDPPPTPLPAEYPLSDLDAQDGFIHLSTAWQIPTTASLYFTSLTSLYLLKLRLSSLGAPPGEIKWDDAPGITNKGCPHLYGRNFGADDVVDVKKFERGEGETWEVVLGRDGWLV
ncbi:hypothetical protein QBC39DRAFT_290444 [Podospora conica]|nr:hypothetical protein QBC39DRAFT_290444 [Schizothecium conicum]